MKILKSLPGWALVFAVTCRLVGAASLDGQCLAELCAEPQIQNDVTRAVGPTPASFARKRMTNAERLSRGLTPNPPARRQHAGKVLRVGILTYSCFLHATSPSAAFRNPESHLSREYPSEEIGGWTGSRMVVRNVSRRRGYELDE